MSGFLDAFCRNIEHRGDLLTREVHAHEAGKSDFVGGDAGIPFGETIGKTWMDL